MRALLLAAAFGVIATPAASQSLELVGYAGVLGEWELAGMMAPNGSRVREYAGPLKVTHVGVCTQDGPEVKNGEMRFQLSGSPASARMKATLMIDGAECTYNARLSDSYSGMMICPDKRAVPLKIWIK